MSRCHCNPLIMASHSADTTVATSTFSYSSTVWTVSSPDTATTVSWNAMSDIYCTIGLLQYMLHTCIALNYHGLCIHYKSDLYTQYRIVGRIDCFLSKFIFNTFPLSHVFFFFLEIAFPLLTYKLLCLYWMYRLPCTVLNIIIEMYNYWSH